MRAALPFVLAGAALLAGCGPEPPLVIGRPGTGDGEFRSPRGLAVSASGVAVLSGIWSARDPAAAAVEYLSAWSEA